MTAKTYKIVVMDGTTPLFLRTLTIWPDDLPATEIKGKVIGMELARDAIHHAGLLDKWKEQRSKLPFAMQDKFEKSV
jgi:hypothetical protein